MNALFADLANCRSQNRAAPSRHDAERHHPILGHPSDHEEREADRLASQVMREGPHEPSGQSSERPYGDTTPAGGTFPLDRRTRRFFEARFKTDLSNVRIHTHSAAAESARSIGALAYSYGRDLVFDSGKYQPRTTEGKRLIAHELAHTVRSGPPTIRRKLSVDPGLRLDTMGFTTTKTGDTYTCPSITTSSLRNEVFTALLHSPREFKVQGRTNAAVAKNLHDHMSARRGIVDFASRKQYSFGAGPKFRMNPT
jgi:Domain of unknown function (DUF4157)